ncbi:cellulase family glycosylhydrolase [Flavivirga jejuensis]|uniref:cellulase n=1 Tax=Flavivirga jejuensis TaxID=870487 RepID=A0ABT8WSK8_9FLAO|nr:cellulase family glycosylhydrolase [Flavivirga jejuensis]MDO5976155.1 cellulase family glycosylhydrolase [Flavivirga jejuensis]
MRYFIFIIFSIVWLFSATTNTHAQQQNFLNTSGNKLFDSAGNEVRLTGVNWFGFETSLYSPHGIWSRDTKSVLKQIKDLGFNTIRIPWCNEMLNPEASITINSFGTDPYSGVSPMNAEEATLSKPIELLDVIVNWCQENNIKIVLDNHSRAADGFLNEAYWYTDTFSEQEWIADWIFLANRYKNFSAVVAMDLNNEPHGSTWGDSNPSTDWNKAAERCGNAILEVHPDVLIIVEGVGEFEGDSYWWGGQLKGVTKYPVQLSNPSKLFYSAHEYGPEVAPQDWFDSSDFPNNMPAIWNEHFHYLYENNTSPLFIGEFGIKNQSNATAYTWYTEWMDFMGSIYSWTFWTMNPNSGDTGGILMDDWTSVNQWKMDVLSPHFAPLIPNVIGGSINTPPLASITASVTSGNAPLSVQFDASGSSDIDGDTLTYNWDFGNGDTSLEMNPLITYTTAGSYTVTLTVNDGEVNSAPVTQTILVEVDGVNTCDFDTPISSALPSLNASYHNIYVLGSGGPNLDNVTTFTINWDLNNNGLYQFSINTNNGTPNWYVDLRESLTASFNSTQPEATFSGTGITGLDGAYWVTADAGNFVMVSKTGGFTLYFSSTASQPICDSSVAKISEKGTSEASEKIEIAPGFIKLTPNPVLDIVTLSSNESLQHSTIKIISLTGRVVMFESVEDDQKEKTISIEALQSGIYILEAFNTKTGVLKNKKIIKK